jgi:N-acetylneuraminic acid mutarotase
MSSRVYVVGVTKEPYVGCGALATGAGATATVTPPEDIGTIGGEEDGGHRSSISFEVISHNRVAFSYFIDQ